VGLTSPKITSLDRDGKLERARAREGGEEQKSNCCTRIFHNGYFGDNLCFERLLVDHISPIITVLGAVAMGIGQKR